jgi:TolA-binding protein
MRRVLVLSFAAVTVGCFFPADRGRLLEGRVDSLGDENKRLKAALAETQGRLDETTAQLKTALEQLDQASRTTGANIGVKVDSTIQELAQLRGQMESAQFKVAELESKLAAAAASSASAAKHEEPKKEELKKPDEPKAFFALADEKARAGEGELARRLFTEFLRRWPRDELVGEAHFALGELLFLEAKCREALYDYGKVIQEHPKTKSAPVAFLRSSDCFKELKMFDEAKLTLNELLKAHPKSEPAKLVKQRLADLEKKPAGKGGKK